MLQHLPSLKLKDSISMDIYSSITITEKIIEIFKPTRLCIKKLEGKYYFCKSTKLDIIKYKGSGEAWKGRMRKYGKHNVENLWVSDWYYCPQEIHDAALHFSKENDIVRSDYWANLAPEWGLDFYTRKGSKESAETRQKKSESHLGEKTWNYGMRGEQSHNYGIPHSEETKKKQSIGLKRYAEIRSQTHNDNISKSLKGNPTLIAAVTGDKNGCFKGYYISPTGERFDSSRKAAVVAGSVDKKTLIAWAKSNKNGWSYEPAMKNKSYSCNN
jgi:hypothetical protein